MVRYLFFFIPNYFCFYSLINLKINLKSIKMNFSNNNNEEKYENNEEIDIFEATEEGKLNVVKEYLRRGGDVDKKNKVLI